MRGLRLFIRPVALEDGRALSEFYRSESAAEPGPELISIVGKLLGRIVAHAAARMEGDALCISTLHVAEELRRKGIGSSLITELETIAAVRGARFLTAPAGKDTKFLESVGFISSNGVLRRMVSHARE